ncbi:MAG TPA: hypothetical protein VGG70_13380 [Candidatus Cybelea sp.]|jgi:hypothetical protein
MNLRATLGDPLRVLAFDNGNRHVARYWLAGSNSTYVIVVEERGYVVSFDAFTDAAPSAVIQTVPADPLGVRLGETIAQVRAGHPNFRGDTDEGGNPFLVAAVSSTIGAEYSFEANRVRRFQWAAPAPKDKPVLAPLTAASGDAVASAIVDLQPNESDGVAWEYRYLAFHPCTQTAQWQLQRQSLLQDGGRAYDDLHVVCPPTKNERDFYFDVTSYFGKR